MGFKEHKEKAFDEVSAAYNNLLNALGSSDINDWKPTYIDEMYDVLKELNKIKKILE